MDNSKKQQYFERIAPHYEGYQELHTHTQASYRDAVTTVDEVARAAKDMGRRAFAITDHGNQMRLFHGFKARTKLEIEALKEALGRCGAGEDDIGKAVKAIGPTDSIRYPTEKMWPWVEKYEGAFVEAAKNSPQYLPGIEMYFQPEKDPDDHSAYHLILYAKDWEGQKALFLIQNLAQLNKAKTQTGQPRTTFEDLERLAGPGAPGHGHLVATSACMGGYIPSILLRQWRFTEKQYVLSQKFMGENLTVSEDDLAFAKDALEEAKEQEKAAKQRLATAKKLAKTDFTSKLEQAQKRVEALEAKEVPRDQMMFGEPASEPSAKLTEARKKLAQLREQAAQSKEAETRMPEYIREAEQCKARVESAKAHAAYIEKELRPLWKYQKDCEKLNEEITQLGDLPTMAREAALRFESIFGKGNFFIELQNHGIPHEEAALPMLYQLIRDTGIPPTVANDIHYATKKDKRKRDLVAAMRFNTPVSESENEPGMDQLYFKTDDEMAALGKDPLWRQGMENTSRIAEMCNVYYEKSMHLPKFDPRAAGFETAKDYLQDFCRRMIPKKYPQLATLEGKKRQELVDTIEQRMAYEFDIIERMGYMNYIAIVQDFIFYARSIGGQTAIGPGRGSAAGSIVCYLADITDIDPLRYGLLFERFLNPERVSMPDIDTDLAGRVRDKVVDYVAKKYAYKGPYACPELQGSVCNIVTENELAARAAIRGVARVTDVAYSVADKLARMIPQVPKITLQKAYDEVPEIGAYLNMDERAKKLFEDAKLVEGIPSQTGVHAAGVIIADKPISEYAPMFWNDDKNCWVIQSDMVECESTLGLLKMDFLGLTTLDVLYTAIAYAKKTHGVNIRLSDLKAADDQDVIREIYAAGATDGVFQFESGGIKKSMVNIQPQSIDDIILMNAAYRPGPMDSIPEITQVKLGKADPAYLIPEMEEILGKTYGSAIYQEQIMQLFQMVGFSLGEADIIRRAMSKKHLDEIVAAKDKFVTGMLQKGANPDAVEPYWQRLLAFASYAFNKSHAAAYSLVSYYTAWMKYHYPCEFMSAVMSYTKNEKIPLYAAECKRLGIKIQKPDINKGVPFFAPNVGENTIRYGLEHIKGVAKSAQTIYDLRCKYGPCEDLRDFVLRCSCFGISSDTIVSLGNSGALDCLLKDGWHRRQLVKSLGYRESKDEPKQNTLIDACNAAIRAMRKQTPDMTEDDMYLFLKDSWQMPEMPSYTPYDNAKMLEMEYELLKLYVSGSPIDPYMDILNKEGNRSKTIGELENGDENVSLAGLVEDMTIMRRKSDGAVFAKFTLEDETGRMPCVAFVRAFSYCRPALENKAVVKCTGRAALDNNANGREADSDAPLQLVLTSAIRLN